MPPSWALSGELGYQGGLSLARLPGHEDHLPSLAGGDPLGGGWRESELALAADDPDGGTMGRAGGKRDRSGSVPPPQGAPNRPQSVSMGSGRPFSSSSPSEVKACALLRPALARTRSEARIWPPSARAQRRAASMTGSPK